MKIASSESTVFAKEIRRLCLELSHKKQTAHLASSLSSADIIAVLFNSILKLGQPLCNISDENRFILSKGHAASALYSALYLTKRISYEDLWSYSESGSVFEEHPNHLIPFVDFPTGSLGHGLPLGCGIALGAKLRAQLGKIFILMSDGECNEGTVWEAAQFAHTKKLSNVIVLIDHNKYQATGKIYETIGSISLREVFQSFGWESHEVDGHNHSSLISSINLSLNSDKPSVIVCNTKKGAGISFMEDNNNWHYKFPDRAEFEMAVHELDL